MEADMMLSNSPISDQQAAETRLSIEQNSATDKPQASALSSKDISGCGPVLAIPQLPSRPQHHADHDNRLQGRYLFLDIHSYLHCRL